MYMVTSSQPSVGDEPVALDENQCGIAADDNSREADKENASENDKISDSCEPNDIQRFPLNVIDLQSAGNKSKCKDINNKISTGNSKIEPSTNGIGEGETKVNQFDNLKKQIKGFADAENQLYEKWKTINKLLGDSFQQEKWLTISAEMYDNIIKIESKIDQILAHIQLNDAHGRSNVEVEAMVIEFESLKKQIKSQADTQNQLLALTSNNIAKFGLMFDQTSEEIKGLAETIYQVKSKCVKMESMMSQLLAQNAQSRQDRTEISPSPSSLSVGFSPVDINNLNFDSNNVIHSRENSPTVSHQKLRTEQNEYSERNQSPIDQPSFQESVSVSHKKLRVNEQSAQNEDSQINQSPIDEPSFQESGTVSHKRLRVDESPVQNEYPQINRSTNTNLHSREQSPIVLYEKLAHESPVQNEYSERNQSPIDEPSFQESGTVSHKRLRVNESSAQNEDSQINHSPIDRPSVSQESVTLMPMIKNNKSISSIVLEWYEGINGSMSIQKREVLFQDKWRSSGAIKNQYSRVRPLIKIIDELHWNKDTPCHNKSVHELGSIMERFRIIQKLTMTEMLLKCRSEGEAISQFIIANYSKSSNRF